MLLPLHISAARGAEADSLTVSDAQNPFIQMRDHVLAGIEMDQQQHPRAALTEFEAAMQICEHMELLDRYSHNGKHWIYHITIPMYVIAAGIYNKLGEEDDAIRYCRKSMGWLEYCDSVELREHYAYEVCLIMMSHRRLDMARNLMARTYRDASMLGKHDHALLCAAFMMDIEDALDATLPKDNPWIARGKAHYVSATQPEVRSIFISLLRKAYLKANMTDEARHLEQLVRQAKANGRNPFEQDAKVTPYDTALLNIPIPATASPQPSPKGEGVLPPSGELEEAAGISERIRYIYQQHYGWVIAIGSVLAIVLLAFVAYAIRQRYMRHRARKEAEQEQTKKYLEGMESERSRMAKELHDGVSNQLFAIEMKLNDGTDPQQARRLLTESREQVRRVSHELMPPEFTHAHLGEVIEDYVMEMDGTNGVAIHFMSDAGEDCYRSIPAAHALEMYRIVQEAVTNAMKHAGASDIYVNVKDKGESLTLRITDNGTARKQGQAGGIGIRTMSQRAQAIGAELTTRSIPWGTVVELAYVKKTQNEQG